MKMVQLRKPDRGTASADRINKEDPPPWEENAKAVPTVRTNGRGQVVAKEIDDSDESFGELRPDSFEVPRIKLIHPVSPEINSQPEAKPGQYWHSGLSENLGPVVRITVLRQTPFLGLLEPNTGKMLARANMDGEWETPHAEFNVEIARRPMVWKLKGSVKESGLGVMGSSGGFWSAATPCFDVIFWVHMEGYEMPVMMTFKKTAARPFRELLTTIEGRKNAGIPRYRQMYDLRAKLVQGPNTQYHVPYFQSAGQITDEGLFARLTDTARMLSAVKVKVVGDDAEERAGPAGPRDYSAKDRGY
jgi:hypothetical protein